MSPIDMLPYELQDKILLRLPTDDAVRYTTVQKEWQVGIKSWASGTPMHYTPHPQKPLYCMFNCEVAYLGTCAYNSDKERWVPFEIPNSNQESSERLVPPLDLPISSQNAFYIAASRGLVCFMDAASQDNISVCNPILKDQIKLLPKAAGAMSDYCAITLSTDVRSRKYTIAMLRSSLVDTIEYTHDMTIQLYESKTRSWVDLHSENSVNWQGGDTCIICKDVLYIVAQFRYLVGGTLPYHAIVAYNISQRGQKQSLARTMMPVPCVLTCVRLLNLNDKLIMVGGIQKQGTTKLETIGIWEMCGNEWKEITRAPHDIIVRFRKIIDDTFIGSGCGNLVFIQAYTSRALLMYEFCNNVWTFAPKPPIPLVKNDSHYFNGFCFEPRLDIVP